MQEPTTKREARPMSELMRILDPILDLAESLPPRDEHGNLVARAPDVAS